MKKIKMTDLLFYVAYVLLMLVDFSGENIFMQEIKKYILVIIVLCLLFNIYDALKKTAKKNNLKIYGMFIITFLIYFFSGIKEPFFMLLFIIAFKKIDFEKFIKNDYRIRICLLIFVILMCYLGFLPNEFTITANGHYRYYMGFGSPNTLGLNCFILVLELLYQNKGKYNKLSFIIKFAFFLFVEYFVCYSRTAILVSCFSFFLFYINRKKLKQNFCNSKKSIKIVGITYIVLTLISLFSIQLYQNETPYIDVINKLLSGRISFASYNLQYYNVSLFGTKQIEVNPMTDWRLRTGVDNMYMFNLIFYGIIGSVYFSYLFYKTTTTDFFKKNKRILLVFILILLYGLSERFMIRITFNPFFLCSSYSLFKFSEVTKNE